MKKIKNIYSGEILQDEFIPLTIGAYKLSQALPSITLLTPAHK